MEYQQLQDEIKAAMKARDNHRRDILRQVHTELKAIEVNERREVTEADVDAMLKRTIKMCIRDSPGEGRRTPARARRGFPAHGSSSRRGG